MSYYNVPAQRLPSLSDVLPADILNSGRFSQFAPYSTNTHIVKQEATLYGDAGYPYSSAPSPATSAWSAYDDAPSPWSHGERTPSLSPSPTALGLATDLPPQQYSQYSPDSQSQANVWISQSAPAPVQPAMPTSSPIELVWMPANMDVASARREQQQQQSTGARKGFVQECHPKNAHGVAYIPPGRTDPIVYMGQAAAEHVAKIVQLPAQQRGQLRFFRYTQA